VTPGLVPKRPTDRVKTDRRDAVRLARLLAAGELSFARVPTEAEEAFRDVVRAREDVRGDLMRARHRLSKFLLRREVVYPGPGGAWTQAHLAWLARLTFDDTASTLTMTDYLAAVHALVQRRATLDAAIAELVPTSPCAATVPVLRCFRGIDTLSAAGLCADIGDFARFAHPKLLAGFLGITPSEHTSDDKRRQGAITKAGPSHARRLLVEAAHHYRRRPHVGVTLQRRQVGADPRVCDVAWRAQQRLYRQWQRLHGQRRKPSGVVTVACARELSAFLWEAATIA
jgi:transposase